MALTPGGKLGPYEIQSPLGAGGMSEVYRARDKVQARGAPCNADHSLREGPATVFVSAVESCAPTIRVPSASVKESLKNYGTVGTDWLLQGKPTASRQQAVLAQLPVQIPLADSENSGGVSAVTLAGFDRQSDMGELRFFERRQRSVRR